eukprot:g43532.t1
MLLLLGVYGMILWIGVASEVIHVVMRVPVMVVVVVVRVPVVVVRVPVVVVRVPVVVVRVPVVHITLGSSIARHHLKDQSTAEEMSEQEGKAP